MSAIKAHNTRLDAMMNSRVWRPLQRSDLRDDGVGSLSGMAKT